MGFLAMSTLALLSKYGGLLSCDNTTAKCITDAQKALFYISLPFIIIGVSGHEASLGHFLKKPKPIEIESDQNKERKKSGIFMSFFRKFILLKKPKPIEIESDQNKERKKSGIFMSFFRKFIRFFVPIIISFALSLLPLFGQFGIPAIVLVLAVALLFVSVSGSDKYDTPQGSPLTTVFRVFVASASKMFCPLPRDAQELYENRPSPESPDRLPHTRGLRFSL
jgi:peptide/histidine transporter 3/4